MCDQRVGGHAQLYRRKKFQAAITRVRFDGSGIVSKVRIDPPSAAAATTAVEYARCHSRFRGVSWIIYIIHDVLRRPDGPLNRYGPQTDAEHPDWFHAFLTDRATRKPWPHAMQAYGQDFDAIAGAVGGGRERIASLTPLEITKESMRQAFAAYADIHAAASIRRCWR